MMRQMIKLLPILFTFFLVNLAGAAQAQSVSFVKRDAERPRTTNGVPHTQIDVEPVPALIEQMLSHVAKFPGVALGPTRVSLPGAVGFQFDADMPLARPQNIVGGREFAHVHPDGSLHASLDPKIARDAVKNGWAIPHPWSAYRVGWEGFVMIYTPLTQKQLDVVLALIESSYHYISGKPVS